MSHIQGPFEKFLDATFQLILSQVNVSLTPTTEVSLGMIYRTNYRILKNFFLSWMGEVTYQHFSQIAADNTDLNATAISYVARNTRATSFSLGPQLKLKLFKRSVSTHFLLGHSLLGSTSANYSSGPLSTSLSGWRFKILGDLWLYKSAWLRTSFDYLTLSGEPSVTYQSIFLGWGIYF